MRVRLTIAAAVGALALAATGSALADPPACPPTDDACAALAARLDDSNAKLDALTAAVEASGGEPVSGTVALDADTTDRLDLLWWGVWAVVGLALLQIVAHSWRRVFTWGTSGGNA